MVLQRLRPAYSSKAAKRLSPRGRVVRLRRRRVAARLASLGTRRDTRLRNGQGCQEGLLWLPAAAPRNGCAAQPVLECGFRPEFSCSPEQMWASVAVSVADPQAAGPQRLQHRSASLSSLCQAVPALLLDVSAVWYHGMDFANPPSRGAGGRSRTTSPDFRYSRPRQPYVGPGARHAAGGGHTRPSPVGRDGADL